MGLRTPDYTFEAYIPKHLEVRCYNENFFISANTDICIDGERVKNIGFHPKDVEHYRGLMSILKDKSLDVLTKEELDYVKSSEYGEIELILAHFFRANYSGNCFNDLHSTHVGKSLFFCKDLRIKGKWSPICAYKIKFDDLHSKLSIEYYDHDADSMKTVTYETPPFFVRCVKAAIKKNCLKDFNSSHPSFSILYTPFISYY